MAQRVRAGNSITVEFCFGVGEYLFPNPDLPRHSVPERAWANGQVARSIVSPRW